MTAYTFETVVNRTRGNLSTGAEREYPVKAGYTIDDDGKVTLTRWTIIGDTWPLTSGELERLDEEAEAHAADIIADIKADRELAAAVSPVRSLAA